MIRRPATACAELVQALTGCSIERAELAGERPDPHRAPPRATTPCDDGPAPSCALDGALGPTAARVASDELSASSTAPTVLDDARPRRVRPRPPSGPRSRRGARSSTKRRQTWPHDDLEHGGGRHGQQQAEEPAERAAGQQRQHHDGRVELHRPLHHDRADEVVVDLLDDRPSRRPPRSPCRCPPPVVRAMTMPGTAPTHGPMSGIMLNRPGHHARRSARTAGR